MPRIIDLGYGRRVNRVWRQADKGWTNEAPAIGFDGDKIRHGVYPDWIKQYAKKTGRFGWVLGEPKKHLVHGNTFDAAITDVDNDVRLSTYSWRRSATAGPASRATRRVCGSTTTASSNCATRKAT